MVQVGDILRIDYMEGEPNYSGKTGEVTYIDDAGQIHGKWGGLAIIPEKDSFTIIGQK